MPGGRAPLRPGRRRGRANGRPARYLVQRRTCKRRAHAAPIHLESTTGAESPHLARKPNYDFEKRRKELDRKAKKDAKREERLQRKQENAENGVEGADPDLEGIVPGPQNIDDIMNPK